MSYFRVWKGEFINGKLCYTRSEPISGVTIFREKWWTLQKVDIVEDVLHKFKSCKIRKKPHRVKKYKWYNKNYKKYL